MVHRPKKTIVINKNRNTHAPVISVPNEVVVLQDAQGKPFKTKEGIDPSLYIKKIFEKRIISHLE